MVNNKEPKKPKTKKIILNSGLSEVELLKIRVAKLEVGALKLIEGLNQLLEQSGLRPIEEQENTAGPKQIRYGD